MIFPKHVVSPVFFCLCCLLIFPLNAQAEVSAVVDDSESQTVQSTPETARAVSQATTTQPTTTTPTPPPPPSLEQQATGTILLSPRRVNGKNAAVLRGDRWQIVGTVTPFIENQKVQIVVALDKRVIERYTLRVRRGSKGLGTFTVRLRSKRVGHMTVRVTHAETEQLAAIKAKPVHVDVLPTSLRRGNRGRKVELVQRHLRAAGYVPGKPKLFDARMGRAAMAFRKMTAMALNERIDKGFLRRLVQGKGRFRVRFPGHGRHVEASISRQVLALINGKNVERIYPVSSGAPATPTIRGSFRVYQKSYGTNKKGMVHSSYFRGGYAIHGYASVPPYPASHGCLRVPVPDALGIYNWVSYNMWVDVYF